ncbi:required for excision 1-B domain-containing protein [Hemicordylus capensis]|uniref:required for excision 1-B domain-containing protein n=1 Tax=Hemicordylus capensis TaxID=884348 RepID=UPI0023045811|nr:required for excision 1-B domain-containing protein [Hemicordylus capensis]
MKALMISRGGGEEAWGCRGAVWPAGGGRGPRSSADGLGEEEAQQPVASPAGGGRAWRACRRREEDARSAGAAAAMPDRDVPSLVCRFYALQSERVEAYRLFEEGHRAYLRSGPAYDFIRYRQLVHEITLAFNGISQEILQIKDQLEGPCGRGDLAQHLGRIQEKEKEKLELTAQLQIAKQNAQDHPGAEAHEQEVRDVKHKLIQTIEAISEILQDFKYDSEENA